MMINDLKLFNISQVSAKAITQNENAQVKELTLKTIVMEPVSGGTRL